MNTEVAQRDVKTRFQLIALLVLIIAALAGCAANPHAQRTNEPDTARDSEVAHDITESEAVKIALKWAAKGWPKDKLEADRAIKDASGIWCVDVWRLPKTPGGFVIIYISSRGEIVRVWGGA